MYGIFNLEGKKTNALGQIFEMSKDAMDTQATKNERLSSHIPGHSEAASSILANIWNTLDLKSARSVKAAKTVAIKFFKSIKIFEFLAVYLVYFTDYLSSYRYLRIDLALFVNL